MLLCFKQDKILEDRTAAPGSLTSLECYSFVLAWSCPGWLCCSGSIAALAAWVSGASCMTLAAPLGSGTSQVGRSTHACSSVASV